MAEFDAKLLRTVAMGPNPSKELLEAVGKFKDPGGTNMAIKAYEDMRGLWSRPQEDLHALSKELLYAAVMLRAAASLEQSGQGVLSQELRQAESNICLKITSKSADQTANRRAADQVSGHEKLNPNLPSSRLGSAAAGAGTENRIHIATFGLDEDGYAGRVLREFGERGFACPPDPK